MASGRKSPRPANGPNQALKLLPVEADCASEIMRSEVFDTRIIESKLRAYLAYARQKRQRRQFGIERMQVLFPTTGDARQIERFVATTKVATDGEGSRRFLFAQADVLFGDVLSDPWTDGQGNQVSVIE